MFELLADGGEIEEHLRAARERERLVGERGLLGFEKFLRDFRARAHGLFAVRLAGDGAGFRRTFRAGRGRDHAGLVRVERLRGIASERRDTAARLTASRARASPLPGITPAPPANMPPAPGMGKIIAPVGGMPPGFWPKPGSGIGWPPGGWPVPGTGKSSMALGVPGGGVPGIGMRAKGAPWPGIGIMPGGVWPGAS